MQYVANIFFQDITNFVSQDCKVAPGHGSEVMLRVKQLTWSLIQYQGLLLTVESTSIGCGVRGCCFPLLFSPERGECCTCGVRVGAIHFKASLAHQFAMFVMRETRNHSPSRSRKRSSKRCLEGTTSMRSNRTIEQAPIPCLHSKLQASSEMEALTVPSMTPHSSARYKQAGVPALEKIVDQWLDVMINFLERCFVRPGMFAFVRCR